LVSNWNLWNLQTTEVKQQVTNWQEQKYMKLKTKTALTLFIWVSLLFSAFSMACSYAHGNMQTLVTSDCGVTWSLVKQGQSLPAQVGVCSYHVTVPDYPMQGTAQFRTNFKGNVKADVDLSYNYRIVDALAFMKEAKYIGKQSSDDKDAKANDTRFEGAENSVIDKHIRDVQRDFLAQEDIVDFDAAAFEEKLLPAVNERLKSRGVAIDFLSFVPNPDVITGDAIDVATALRIYKNNGVPDDVAYRFIQAKLGAAKLGTIEPTPQPEPKKDDK
jgi:hypothetical protein